MPNENYAENKAIDVGATAAIQELTATNEHQQYKEKIAQKVEKRIGRKVNTLVGKALELAQGVKVTRYNGETDEIVAYDEKPNLNAIIYLLDRLMGKPTIKSEVKEEKKGIFIIEHMIKKLADSGKVVEGEVIKNEVNESVVENGSASTAG